MAGCCDPSGYRGVFNTKTAERSVRSFIRRGLDSTAGPMVEALRRRGIDGATVLEVGAGAGTAIVSMLESGAVAATGIDLSPDYEDAARDLFTARGMEDAVEWRTGDIVALVDEVPAGDVVFLNRVVCCYPFADELVSTSIRSSRRLLAMSFPRNRLLVRVAMRVLNGWLRLVKNSFRVFLHDPKALVQRVEDAGYRSIAAGTTPGWHWNVWERTESPSGHEGSTAP